MCCVCACICACINVYVQMCRVCVCVRINISIISGRDALARFPVSARYRVLATRRVCFCRDSYARFVSQLFGFNSVGFKSYFDFRIAFKYSPDGLRVFGRRRDASEHRRRLSFHPVKARCLIRILVRRQFHRRRYQSAEAAFSLPSGLVILARISLSCFACLLTSLALERIARISSLCRREPVLYSANYPRRRIR